MLEKKEYESFFDINAMTEFENNYTSEDEVKILLKDTGFVDIEIRKEVESYKFETAKELADFFKTFLFSFKKIMTLPEEMKESLAMKCAEEWIATSESDQISYSWENLLVTAKKPE